MKKFILRNLLVLSLVVALILVQAISSMAAGKILLTVQTPPTGTSWYNWSAGVVKAISLGIPEASVNLEVVGSTYDNMRCLAASKGNTIGSTTTNVALAIYKGEKPFKKAFPEIRLISNGPPTVLQWVVRKDSGVREFKDLEGKRWNPGGKASSTEKTTLRLLEMLNVKPDLRSYSQTDVADAIINGDIVGSATSGAPPSPFIMQLLAKKEIVLLGLTKDQVDAFIKKYPHYAMKILPAGTYKGVDYPVNVVGIDVGLFVRKGDDPELVYRIVKALWSRLKEREEICTMLEKDPKEITIWSRPPMHPGAVKYYREIGVKLPDSLIPPEMK